MRKISEGKRKHLEMLSNEDGVIAALAIDQRGSIRKMMAKHDESKATEGAITDFKCLVSESLTPYSSAILLDPEYGIPAMEKRDKHCGLLVAYERTGYDATEPGRLPDLLPIWSVKRIAELGANAVKILLYYDVDEPDEINDQKKAFVERIGAECKAEEIPFFFEIVTYDSEVEDVKSKAYAKIKPHKVIESVKVFTDPRYGIDVLKLEVPVNMDYVEGYGKEVVYTREEALKYFKAQSDATDLPFIFLSAGVETELFQKTLVFAKEAGSTFNGVLCGRATWKEGVEPYTKGVGPAKEWLMSQGKKNVEDLNETLKTTATSWKEKFEG